MAWAQHGAIFCYHEVMAHSATDAAAVHLSAAQLAEHVALVQSLGEIIPLADLLARIGAGTSTAGLYALTFDDAYEGVLRHALPVLQAAGAPAAVFPVSTAVHGARRFWWDRLEAVLPRVTEAGWHVLEQGFGVTTARGQDAMPVLREAVLWRMRGRLTERAEEALQVAEQDARIETALRSVNAAELLALAKDPHISIGPHTATHPALALLDDGEVTAEVERCVRALGDLGIRQLPVLAAPYGAGDARTVALSQRAGMAWCLGTAPRTLGGATASRPVPRYVMSAKRSGWRFRAQLAGVTDTLKRMLGRSEPDWVRLQGPREA